jgi:hypothetical protein
MLALALVALVVVLWRLGEKHRHDCIAQGKVHCTVLPWSGTYVGIGVNPNQGLGGAINKSLEQGTSTIP